jgi:hypothetical protein
MVWARKGLLACMFGSVLATMGCCYHAAHFGRERDIGVGEVGCGASCRTRCCGYMNSCRPGPCGGGAEPIGMPGNLKPMSGVVPATYFEGEMPLDQVRRAGTGEFPIYVLPQDSVSNAVLVSPTPLPAVAPRKEGR